VAESGGLENRYTRKGIEGSNPSLSAILSEARVGARERRKLPGEMSEWLKEHGWKPCKHESASWVRIPLSPPVVKHLNPRFGGDVAQLGERLVRNEEVTGSIPVISTKSSHGLLVPW
jgi:hypothetical protein